MLRRMLSTAAAPRRGPVASLLASRLTTALSPTSLELVDESPRHALGGESHFKLVVVSPAFEGLGMLARHRAVNAAARGGDADLPSHALSINAKTPAEADAGGAKMQTTPGCQNAR